MKRLTALFLAVLFLFNLAGYRLFFHYLQEKADGRYEQFLDRNKADASEMITLKVELEMPYLAENTSYERVDGEIDIDGVIYKYVKRKIHNGQLVLLCLPDQTKTKLKTASSEYFNYTNNLASHSDAKPSQKASFEKSITSDYDQLSLTYYIGHLPRTTTFEFSQNETFVSSEHCSLPAQPPEFA
ncbi:MAG: hypothetical protein JNK79_08070 [Chitinophagaceae bacterium]|nr:hypothetical protein [Chitinophagaceae bacterium]